MCEEIAAQEGTNPEVFSKSIREEVGKFYECLLIQKYGMQDIIGQMIKMKEKILFAIAVIDSESMVIFNGSERLEAKHGEKVEIKFGSLFQDGLKDRIHGQFKEPSGPVVEYCRCLGGRANQYLVYYYCMLPYLDDTDVIYLSQAEHVYYRFLSNELARYLKACEVGNKVDLKPDVSAEVIQKTQAAFCEYMKRIFGIDINILTELVGSYYEGKPCECNLVFNLEKERGVGIELAEPIKIESFNVRKIRKCLEMGRKDYCAVACWDDSENCWSIKGIFPENVDRKGLSIAVSIQGHMIWRMGIAGKTIVTYRCGNYEISSFNLRGQEFTEKFLKTYQRNANQRVIDIFERAAEQKHGTIIIILDSKKIKREAKRLVNKSIGIQLNNKNIEAALIDGVTSIDGAMLIDEEGDCYGIGMILDSSTSINGKKERGARYTSTIKYVKGWKKRGAKCLGVVVSEDRTIDIISTQDDI